MTKGVVHLVGAGPGDPGLITVRGMDLLRQAETVVFDSLANPELLKEAPPGAEMIDVGKRGGLHKAEQDEINQVLLERASQGRAVVRLKGGDPFLFGRGGEEAEFLRLNGVEVHVVPGVSAGLAVPALAGIPVTHRTVSSSVTIVTGHEGAHKDAEWLDWAALARGGGTLVIMMGMSNIDRNMRRLMEGGVDAETPVAVVQDGSSKGQKVLVTTASRAAEDCERERMRSPSVIVVGEVVNARSMLGDLR
ncbi:MAG TPA: uroporphyrinogen-III C-methyltransferase [Methanomassiliicoccales archaeon]|nr:uroporphyrinogen-III C-methyltransferase [Methanomassiliicoccales archaeon]